MILAGLASNRSLDRTQAVEKIRTDVRTHGGQLRFKAIDKLFVALADLLRDSNWTVRRDTLALLIDVVPKSGRRMGYCITQVVPALLHNLGDGKVVVRRGAVAAIRVRVCTSYYL